MEVLILTELNIKNNPLVYMYANSLKDKYSVTITCKDYENKKIIDGVQLLPSGESILNSSKKIKSILDKIENKINIKKRGKIHIKFSLRYFRKNIAQLFNKKIYKKSLKCIIAIDGETLLAAKILSKILRVPYVYVVYEIWPNQYSHYSKDQINTMMGLEKYFINNAKHTIVVNQRWADLLRRRYKSENNFEIVTVAPEIPLITNLKTEVDKGNLLKIHYHGGVNYERGVEELIYAMELIEGAKLYIRPVGNVKLIQELKEYVRFNNMNDKVEFLEPVNMKDLAYAASEYDVGIVIAKNKTLQGRMVTGFKLFEYMSSGLAIIAPKSYPIKNVFKESDIGILFDQTEAKEIAKAIQYLADNPQEVIKMKKLSYQLAKDKYNFEEQSKRLNKLIDNI